MARVNPQKARVLRTLRQRGAEGITAADFLGPVVIDGGAPIIRLAARVVELRKQGHRISASRDPNGLTRYRLSPPADAPTRVHVAPPAPAQEPLTAAPRSAILGPEDDAA